MALDIVGGFLGHAIDTLSTGLEVIGALFRLVDTAFKLAQPLGELLRALRGGVDAVVILGAVLAQLIGHLAGAGAQRCELVDDSGIELEVLHLGAYLGEACASLLGIGKRVLGQVCVGLVDHGEELLLDDPDLVDVAHGLLDAVGDAGGTIGKLGGAGLQLRHSLGELGGGARGGGGTGRQFPHAVGKLRGTIEEFLRATLDEVGLRGGLARGAAGGDEIRAGDHGDGRALFLFTPRGCQVSGEKRADGKGDKEE